MSADTPQLLTLPWEIRSLIYDQLFCGLDRFIFSPHARRTQHSPSPRRAHPASALLRTCKLISREVQRAVVQSCHLYCCLQEHQSLLESTFLPDWFCTQLKHVHMYRSGLLHDADAGHAASLEQASMHRQLADPNSPLHQSVRSTFPSLESLDLVYFWPPILGRLKHRLDLFFEGERDAELLSLVKIAFRFYEPHPTSRITNGGAEHAADQPGEAVVRVRISVTGHFVEDEPMYSNGRRCLCIRYALPDYTVTGRWTGWDYHHPGQDKLGWHPHA